MILLILVAIPALFFMLVWVTVTAYRIVRPDEPTSKPKTLAEKRIRRVVRAYAIIEEAQHTRHQKARYQFIEGESDGFPEHWLEDVWARRN